MNRRENEESLNTIELDEIRLKLRQFMLIQEQLYRQYSGEVTRFTEERHQTQTAFEAQSQENRELKATVHRYE
jgi:hypothetical protein